MIEYDIFGCGKRYAVTMSFDDGAFDEKLMGIFNKYGIKGTFHLNSGKIKENGTDKIRELYKGHEIACHGVTHRSLTYIPLQGLIDEVFADRKKLEKTAGYPVTGYSYANGVYNDDVVCGLKSMGIEYSRTVQNTHSFSLPDDFMKWHPTCHYSESIEYGKRFIDSMDGYFGFPKLLYVWGHGHELEHKNHWEMMEEFCALVGGNDRVWYATNIEIYRYIKAQRSLVISADESMVYNPSSTKVWFSKNGKDYMICGGETLYID